MKRLLLATVFLPAALCAQTIRGTVVDPTDRAVSGVVVLMLDSASHVVARGLTNPRGDFTVASPRAGTYTLRTMRIGFRPTVSPPIKLFFGGESTQRIRLDGIEVQLDTIRVVDKSSCKIDRDVSAAATFAAFDQARTALLAAQLTIAGRPINATTLAYTRTLDENNRRVLNQASSLVTARVAQPWRAIGPDSVHRAGFVIFERDNSVTYHAPSIDVLISSGFIEDHCFHLANDRRRPEEIGVAFEPSPERRSKAEIKGTLWLDRKSAELRRLEYRYVNFSELQDDAGADGEVEYGRLKDGGWVIARWDVRIPVRQQVEDVAGSRNRFTRTVTQVTGGALFLVTAARDDGRDTLWSRPALALNGELVDSVSGRAIANGHVELAGTGLGASSDARGRFSIAGVLPGVYTVESRTPELDKIGATNQTSLTFDDSTKSYQIRVPTAAQLVAGICPSKSVGAGDGAIIGRVFQRGDTIPAMGSKVVAEWTVLTARPGEGNNIVRDGRRVEGRTAADGMFRLCGVPTNTAVTVSASDATSVSAEHETTLSGLFARVDLVMDRVADGSATFTGAVLVDSLKTPIMAAQVSIVDLDKSTISDSKGAFTIRGIPAGEHHVLVRRVGYGPLDTKLTFADNRTLTRNVFLAKVVTLDSVVVQSTTLIRQMADFEENRRIGLGKFWTRADLEKYKALPLASALQQTSGMNIIRGHGNHAWVTASRGNHSLGAGAYKIQQSDSVMGALDLTCYATVYVDGVRVFHPSRSGTQPPLFDLSEIAPEQIEGVEYYAGASSTPAQYNDLDSSCGVLVIHTRRTP